MMDRLSNITIRVCALGVLILSGVDVWSDIFEWCGLGSGWAFVVANVLLLTAAPVTWAALDPLMRNNSNASRDYAIAAAGSVTPNPSQSIAFGDKEGG